ncbi:type II toxin-antitoxin system death-on-curing family toxin [Chitinophaga sp. 30R24]|uniref:type II toxin-antitoxin system death-on-curing family toxin n=1 Tax=Chitinophaga sp. 30R24 TaxID=3248838 RepID=UPI003B9053C4
MKHPIRVNIFLLGLLIQLLSMTCYAQTGFTIKKMLDGAKGELVAGKSANVQDTVYFDATLKSKLESAYTTRNIITFKLNEYSAVYPKGPFTATAQVRIIYDATDQRKDSLERSMTISYDTVNAYTARNSFVFNNAHDVTIRLLSITTGDAAMTAALVLENELQVKPAYKLDKVNDVVRQLQFLSPTAANPDQITVNWEPVNAADEYDLEWTYIDATALANKVYGDPVNTSLVFRNNASRVSVSQNGYNVPLIYDNNGTLYARVRPVQARGNSSRKEAGWSNVAAFSFGGHENNLNWQSSISYAEEGKRKVVVQYFDGSMMGRQTVTKDNTTDTTVVSETLYDKQGRPVIQVLPTPTLSNIIAYTKSFNKGVNGAYDVSNYDTLTSPAAILTAAAAPMDSSSGAARYYSAANPRASAGFNRYIPASEGYPFTETVYTPDNTGRISRQGGVGQDFAINSGHETRYYYGAANQAQIDRLFGTEGGNETHYFRNMVKDANGQYSVSYQDMHGRTVATSLVGEPVSGALKGLPSNIVTPLTEVWGGGANNQRNGNALVVHKPLVVPADDVYTFTYSLVPPVLKKKDCNGTEICYIGRFDLEISITDDVMNQLLPDGKPVTQTFSNYNAGSIISDCSTPSPVTLTFSVPLKEGSYEVVKTLAINEEAMEGYRQQLFLKGNTCVSLEQILEEQRQAYKDISCATDCQSCIAIVGSRSHFAVNYMTQIGLAVTDSVHYRKEIDAAYADIVSSCDQLCEKTTLADNTRMSMLLDMTPPSGQYAEREKAAEAYNIFFSRPTADDDVLPAVYQRADLQYQNADGSAAQVYDETRQAMVRPQALTPQQFADKFQSSWAQALLPLHPEYCKLLEYEKHKASLAWDIQFKATDTYAEAKAKGYLNPTNGSGNVFAFYGASANPDPLASESAAIKNGLEATLITFQNGKSIYTMSAAAVMCTTDAASCMVNYSQNESVFKESTLCAGDLNMIWRSFRENYQNIKQHYIDSLLEHAACPAGAGKVSARDLFAQGKQPNFMTAGAALAHAGLDYLQEFTVADKQRVKDSAAAQLDRFYTDNCNRYVSTWMEQLSPCNYTSAEFAALKDRLIAVCKAGSDAAHPYGSSSVPNNSPDADRSFEQVIRDFNATHPDVTGKGDRSAATALLVTVPSPYYAQSLVTGKPSFNIPEACECDKIAAFKREYDLAHKVNESTSQYLFRSRHVNIAQEDLNLILQSCTLASGCTYQERPVQLPPVFQCYSAAPCATCIIVDSLYNRFMVDYPGIVPAWPSGEDNVSLMSSTGPVEDAVQVLRNQEFATYLNNRLGYKYDYSSYLQFIDSCRILHYENTIVGSTSNQVNQFSLLWNGVPSTATIRKISRTRSGEYLLAGNLAGSTAALLVKLDAGYQLLWAKSYSDGPGLSNIVAVEETQDGGVLLGAYTANHPGGMTTTYLPTVLRLDGTGNLMWYRAFYSGSPTGEILRDLKELSNGHIAFIGDYDAGSYTCDWMVGVLDASGNTSWQRRMSKSSGEMSQFMVEDGGNIVVSSLRIANTSYVADLFRFRVTDGAAIDSASFQYNNNSLRNLNTCGLYPLPGGGYSLVLIAKYGTSDGTGAGAVMNINRDLTFRSAYELSGGTNISWMGSGMLNDGSLLLAANTANGSSIVSYRLTGSGTILNARSLSVPANTEIRNLFMAADSSILAIGHVGGNPGVGIFPTGVAGCMDVPATITATPVSMLSLNPLLDRTVITPTTIQMSVTVSAIPGSRTGSGCQVSTGTISLYTGPLLCGQTGATFPEVAFEEPNNCTDSSFNLINTATAIYKARLDSLKDTFNEDYLASCYAAMDLENFTVQHNLSEYHYTLYYYDQGGNLVKTIPPEGVMLDLSQAWLDGVRAARAAGTVKVPAHSLATVYRYNTLNQVVSQGSPDGGNSLFWYDRLGRLVVSQNAEQRKSSAYSYTRYDYLGRITEVGQLVSAMPITSAISRDNTQLEGWLTAAADSRTQITKTTYDLPYTPVAPLLEAQNLRNRVSWSAVYNTAADLAALNHASATYYSYDIHGNVDTLLQDYRLGAMGNAQNRFKKLVYHYDLVSGKVNQVAYQPGMPDAFYHRYSYDAENRITNVLTSTDSIYWENDAFYQYYQHGLLAKSILGQQQVQGIDYAYTLQGWLKGVNSTNLSPVYDIGGDGGAGSLVARDAFGYTLHYSGDRDYRPVSHTAGAMASGVSTTPGLFVPLFNGNIGAMSVSLPTLGEPLLYAYRYDVLNRLSSMRAASGFNVGANRWQPAVLPDFGESVTYDANGNIKTYIRNGNHTFAGKPLAMDSLSYAYKAGTNQLDYIEDGVAGGNYPTDIDNQAIHNYTYDAIGNLTADKAAGVSSISWTVYGKIQQIHKSDGTDITYTYDVAGNRISKKVKNVETWYIRDATGNVMGIYTKGDSSVNNGDLTLTETHLYGSSRLGLLNRQVNVEHIVAPETVALANGTGLNTIFKRGYKVFELGNHLGNVLATVSDRKRPISLNGSTISYFDPVLTSVQDYYPFGMLMPGRSGHALGTGWSSGTDDINGYTLPIDLSLNNRSDNQPLDYVATRSIELLTGFTSGDDDNFSVYIADDTYAGGGNVNGASGGVGGYRYGFNGQEKDNEIQGEGNAYTAQFWEYDPRIGRRWNLDPKSTVGISHYSAFNNSPIAFGDPLGDTSSTGTRIMGGLKTVGGVIEMGVGAAGGIATSWTVGGAVLGGLAVVHGADVTSHGLTELITGQEAPTYTQQGISLGLQTAGLKKSTADATGNFVDGALGIIFSSGAGLVKVSPYIFGKGPLLKTVSAEATIVKEEFDMASFADKIVGFNKTTNGGGVLLNGSPSSAIFTAQYYSTIAEQGAAIFRSISHGHMFQDGNKRTAVMAWQYFAEHNGIKTLSYNELMTVATEVATGAMHEVEDIARAIAR